MKWGIQQLLSKKHEQAFNIEDDADVSEMIERDKELRDISAVHVQGEGTIVEETFHVHLRLTGTMILPCARTLADVHHPFDVEMFEAFRLDGMPADEENVNEHEPEDGFVDLLPYIKENIFLEMPLRVFAKEGDGEPLAPQSGDDWRVISEDELIKEREQEAPKVDPRMADLSKYFDKGSS